MNDDSVWQAFAETGEPVCYLLYRAVHAAPRPTTTTAEA